MIEIGIITAPRIKPTLDTSMQFIRRSGFYDPIKVFAEPGEYTIRHLGFDIIKNKKRLGCFKNYHNALTELAKTDKPYVLVLSDDFIYNKLTYKYIVKAVKKFPDFGYLALFTPYGMTRPPCSLTGRGWIKVNKGWANSFGGLYVMKTEVARKILKHEYYLNHLQSYKLNQQIDHCIPEVCFQMGLDQYFHSPSLADHIGKVSTIGHVHSKETKGLNFRI